MDEITITYNGEELTVVGRYEPPQRGSWNTTSGDPGWNEEPAEFYIVRIYNWEGKEVTYQYTEADFREIEEIVIEKHE